MKVLDNPCVLKAPSVDMPDSNYQKLAKKLGVKIATHPSDILLKNLLSTLAIPVYDYSAVRNYMISKRPEKHYFIWCPAVGSKAGNPEVLMASYGRWHRGWSATPRRHGSISVEIYNKPVPYPVMVTMDSILTRAEAMGFEPRFYISDFAKGEERPQRSLRIDPFLAVGTSNSNALFVIERWDEPGFREEVYRKKTNRQKTAVKK